MNLYLTGILAVGLAVGALGLIGVDVGQPGFLGLGIVGFLVAILSATQLWLRTRRVPR